MKVLRFQTGVRDSHLLHDNPLDPLSVQTGMGLHQGRDVPQVHGTVSNSLEDDEVFCRGKGELEVSGGNTGTSLNHFPFKRQQAERDIRGNFARIVDQQQNAVLAGECLSFLYAKR